LPSTWTTAYELDVQLVDVLVIPVHSALSDSQRLGPMWIAGDDRTTLCEQMAKKKKAGKKKTWDRDLARSIVKKHHKIFERLKAMMSGRRFRHPHGHLFARSPLMKNLKKR
jgi:hypothetical protein